MFMETVRETDNTEPRKGGPNPGLLRPPLIFLVAILMGIAINQAWPLRFLPPIVRWLGPLVAAFAVALFLLSYRAFGAAGTPVQGSKRTTVIVRTGPYRFSRNPIYLAFILFGLGLSFWVNNLWLLLMLVPAAAIMALVVVPREERFLKQHFNEGYSSYQAAVRRWF
jgi:protein-S-isoprenylcysteine O-methyltransferase Ste14